jgi:hypothetical protein
MMTVILCTMMTIIQGRHRQPADEMHPRTADAARELVR